MKKLETIWDFNPTEEELEELEVEESDRGYYLKERDSFSQFDFYEDIYELALIRDNKEMISKYIELSSPVQKLPNGDIIII